MSKEKRRKCICGKSKTFPLCDFSHQSEKWQCQPAMGNVTEWCFISGPQNFNLAEKLASDFGGVAAHLSEEKVIAENRVVLVEGVELDALNVLMRKVSAQSTIVFTLNVGANLLANVFPDAQLIEINGETLEVWQAIRAKLKAGFDDSSKPNVETKKERTESLFVSHAVADEAFLKPAVDYIRKHFSTDVFLCADSILPGTDWQSEILQRLKQQNKFVYVLSKHSINSTFCAFEIGYAFAIGKDVSIISIDGTLPPAFAQNVQMADVERLRLRSPWLDSEDAFLELILDVL